MKAEDMQVWSSIEKALSDGPKEKRGYVYSLNDVADKLQRASEEVHDFDDEPYIDAMFYWGGHEAKAIADGDEGYWDYLSSVIADANHGIDVEPDEF
jgi:hypothetical protein